MISSTLALAILAGPTTVGVDVRDTPAFDACNVSRSLISPDGHWVAVWTRLGDIALNPLSPRGGHSAVQVVSVECLSAEKTACPATRVKVRDGLRGLSWTDNSDLILLTGGRDLVHVGIKEKTTTTLGSIPKYQSSERLTLSGPLIFSDLNKWLSTIQREKTANTTLESIYATHNDFGWTIFEKATLRYAFHFLREGTVEPLALPGSPTHLKEAPRYYREPHAFIAASGLFGPADRKSEDGKLVNPQPIFDARTGNPVGAFDDRSVVWSPSDFTLRSPSEQAGLDYRSDVSVNLSTGLMTTIEKRIDGSHQLRIIEDGRASSIQCPDQTGLWKSSRIVPLDVEYADWGSRARPLPVRIVRRSGARGLVVIWRGGPAGTFTRGQSQFVEQDWLRRGFDTVVVEQTGSADASSLRRLKEEGYDAIRRDSNAVATGIAALKPQGRLAIFGTSYGATAAAETARLVSKSGSSPELILVAPWLVYRDPAERGDSDEFYRINPEFARRADADLFGAPFTKDQTGFGDQMAKWRAQFQFQGRTLVVFGETDRISRPTDLWESWQTSDKQAVTMIPKAGHGTVSELANKDIDSWLAHGEKP